MSLPRLKQIDQDGASIGEVVTWDGSRWVPDLPGLVLVDRVEALVNVTSLTLTGLNSQTDGAYFVVGKIIFDNNSAFALVPDGITTHTNLRGYWNQSADLTPTGTTLGTLTQGWPVGGAISADAINTGSCSFHGWIWGKGGAGGRFYRGIGSLDASAAGERRMESWGTWQDPAYTSFSTLLVGGFGSTIVAGSEVMLYKARF